MIRKTKNIAVTTGDVDGIGLEVSVKALLKVGPRSDSRFFLFRSDDSDSKYLKKLDRRFQRIIVNTLSEGIDLVQNEKRLAKNILVDIQSDESPPKWVEDAASACRKKWLHGICTAPMSKELIHDCGFKDMGHTEILARVAGVRGLRMGFIGDQFNVVLATGHLPLRKVSQGLTLGNLKRAIFLAQGFAKLLRLQNKPLALLGLNPHAGERGLIGDEEINVLKPVIQWARRQNIRIEGPLTPDAAFFRENWKKFSCFVACYHDQGLIPFKMIHGQDSGCHVTLGLPFVRTSVDHGTAKDIFGRNKANPQSMISALQYCIKFAR